MDPNAPAPDAAYPVPYPPPDAYPPPGYAQGGYAAPAYPPPGYGPPAYPPNPYPEPYPPPAYGPNVHVHAGPMIPSLPGMPPIPAMPGLSVQISNVVVPHPMPAPQHMLPQHPHEPARPGVVQMMRADAAHRTMEAVARRGPARVLAYGVGMSASALTILLLTSIAWGTSVVAALVGTIPLLLIAFAAFYVGARAGHGVASHHLEQAILRVAARERGQVRVVSLAQETGCSLRECQIAIDAMVRSGHATVESDDGGNLLYRVPELEPNDKPRVLTAHAEILPDSRSR